ncbi:Multidrug resistance outer membrane protein MdtP precursor [Photobacterium piscicola]|uniref:Multidrug resistance outer membrane protein MdtP n=1 Tax=Photobacterium piscicola TaxID=1378299 RepID=A0A1T5HY08_9GAMM|nr:efflux transporter outer membrane subunit [Photobacterium piscicola]SKC31679.1 Multidrug resistance outer membrane protein MdtP precursor [Photobacterium piscicola]
MKAFYITRTASSLAAVLLLSACSMIPPSEPQHHSLLTAQQVHLYQRDLSDIKTDWWTQFNDLQLNQLITLGLTNNLTLQQAQQRIELATQQVALAQAGDKPSVNLNISGGAIGANLDSLSPHNAEYSALGMLLPSFSYQFDFWGKNKAIIAAATNQKLSLEAQAVQAKLLLSAAISSSYFTLQNNYRLEQNLQLLLRETNKQKAVISDQIKRGLASKAELFQQQGDLDKLSAQLSMTVTQQQLAKNQLALYLAKTPEQLGTLLTPNAHPINQLNTMTTIPMNLLGRRADIIANKWLVEANQQGIKQAKAAYYPDMNLMVMGVFQKLSSMNPADLFLSGATIATTLPLYDGGVRDANYASANIHYDQAVTVYNQSVLTAVKQASDAIVNLQEALQQQALTVASTTQYQQAYMIFKHRYQRGLASFSEMNNAQIKWHQQVIQTTNADNATLQNQLQLIVALGGGYHA